MRAKLVLLDADVIIEAFRQGIWNDLVSKVQVLVARPIVEQADFYPDSDSGQERRIDLQTYIDTEAITVVDATDENLKRVDDRCSRCLDIHAGEKDALAALPDLTNDCRFCTGDKAAIQALVLLDMADRTISMEQMLGDAGVRRKESLPRQFTREYLNGWLWKGSVLKAMR
jgi:hypothetical protein